MTELEADRACLIPWRPLRTPPPTLLRALEKLIRGYTATGAFTDKQVRVALGLLPPEEWDGHGSCPFVRVGEHAQDEWQSAW